MDCRLIYFCWFTDIKIGFIWRGRLTLLTDTYQTKFHEIFIIRIQSLLGSMYGIVLVRLSE